MKGEEGYSHQYKRIHVLRNTEVRRPKMPTNQFLLRSMSMAVLVSTTLVVAQSNENSEEAAVDSVWVGVVTADNANVRCGANESYYTVATANQGDLVQIHGKRQDWIKIDTLPSKNDE